MSSPRCLYRSALRVPRLRRARHVHRAASSVWWCTDTNPLHSMVFWGFSVLSRDSTKTRFNNAWLRKGKIRWCDRIQLFLDITGFWSTRGQKLYKNDLNTINKATFIYRAWSSFLNKNATECSWWVVLVVAWKIPLISISLNKDIGLYCFKPGFPLVFHLKNKKGDGLYYWAARGGVSIVTYL